MKGSLTVVAFFCAGCLMGVANDFQFDLHDLSMYVLYALMFQVCLLYTSPSPRD